MQNTTLSTIKLSTLVTKFQTQVF